MDTVQMYSNASATEKDADSKSLNEGRSELKSVWDSKSRIWLVVVALCFLGSCIHLTTLIMYYSSTPTNTQRQASAAAFEFPDVTVCPTTQRSYTRRRRDDRPLAGSNVTSNEVFKRISDFWHASDKLNSANDSTSHRPLARRSILPFLRNSTTRHERQDLIYDCKFAGEQCSFENFTNIFHEHYHRCFLFRPNRRKMAGTGEANGLTLILYALDSDNTMKSNAEYVQFRRGHYIIINAANVQSDTDKSKILAAMGTDLAIAVTMQLRTHLNISQYPCESATKEVAHWNWNSENDTEVHREYYYSYSRCIHHQLQNIMWKECNCLDEKYEVPMEMKQYSGCHQLPIEWFVQPKPLSLEYLEENFKKQMITIRSRRECIKNMYKDLAEHVEKAHELCRPSCRQKIYTAVRNENKWPTKEKFVTRHVRQVLLNRAQYNVDRSRNKLVAERVLLHLKKDQALNHFHLVHVFPSSLTSSATVETLAYPANNLLSDIGGTLGLWIGVSVVTLAEMMELLLMCMYSGYHEAKKRRLIRRKEQNMM